MTAKLLCSCAVLLQARQSLTEQHKLIAEKNALIETVKRLNREVAKLEHFKRNLLQQLQDDAEVTVGLNMFHLCKSPSTWWGLFTGQNSPSG